MAMHDAELAELRGQMSLDKMLHQQQQQHGLFPLNSALASSLPSDTPSSSVWPSLVEDFSSYPMFSAQRPAPSSPPDGSQDSEGSDSGVSVPRHGQQHNHATPPNGSRNKRAKLTAPAASPPPAQPANPLSSGFANHPKQPQAMLLPCGTSSMAVSPAAEFFRSLTHEELQLIEAEGTIVPRDGPLTKETLKHLKQMRRKVRNKLSAQDSRRKHKEYLAGLEKANADLESRVSSLEQQNSVLVNQLKHLAEGGFVHASSHSSSSPDACNDAGCKQQHHQPSNQGTGQRACVMMLCLLMVQGSHDTTTLPDSPGGLSAGGLSPASHMSETMRGTETLADTIAVQPSEPTLASSQEYVVLGDHHKGVVKDAFSSFAGKLGMRELPDFDVLQGVYLQQSGGGRMAAGGGGSSGGRATPYAVPCGAASPSSGVVAAVAAGGSSNGTPPASFSAAGPLSVPMDGLSRANKSAGEPFVDAAAPSCGLRFTTEAFPSVVKHELNSMSVACPEPTWLCDLPGSVTAVAVAHGTKRPFDDEF